MPLPMEIVSECVGTVLQNPEEQILATSVEEEVALALEWRPYASHEIRKRVDGALGALGMADLLSRSVFTLSSGEMQKCAIASVLAAGADIVVMDEPSANLSPKATEDLAKTCLELKRRGVTLIIVDHRLYWLRGVVDRLLVLNGGAVVFNGASGSSTDVLDELAAHPRYGEWGLRRVDVAQGDIPPSLKSGGTPAIEIRNASFSYSRRGRLVFRDFSAAVSHGAVTALVGENGAGKTTLCRLVAGLSDVRKGCILFDGELMSARRRRRAVAFVMQQMDVQLYMRTVLDELYYSAPRSTPKRERSEKAKRWMEVFGLAHLKNRHPHSLSGGEKQRLVIACAFMKSPDVMILDEPTSGLDGRNMEIIARELKVYAASGGTVLLVTHDLEFLSLVADVELEIR